MLRSFKSRLSALERLEAAACVDAGPLVEEDVRRIGQQIAMGNITLESRQVGRRWTVNDTPSLDQSIARCTALLQALPDESPADVLDLFNLLLDAIDAPLFTGAELTRWVWKVPH